MLVEYVWMLAICRQEYKALLNMIESESKIPISSLDLVQRESVVFWLISPGAIQIFPPCTRSRSIDCAMCTQSMCSTEF